MNGSPFLVIVQEMFPLMPCSALTWPCCHVLLDFSFFNSRLLLQRKKF